jgi:NAD(P)-dependent dehydrogenase (short-subunit alcohol dehydrogenase family)
MDITGSVALVTGANGGIGRAFVGALLKRGAAKIYIAARDPASLSDLLKGSDGRLVPLRLDVTDAAQVAAAATAAPDVTLLVNNAGYAAFQGAIAAPDISAARREMDVNYFGPLALTRAFKPALAASGGGAVVNMLSMAALVSLPVTGTYSASKAAFLRDAEHPRRTGGTGHDRRWRSGGPDGNRDRRPTASATHDAGRSRIRRP